jgi:hypothetical protein
MGEVCRTESGGTMRLRVAGVAAVLIGAAAAGIGAAASPVEAVVARTAPAATAATAATASSSQNPSIAIRAIDREGKPVPVTATLQSARKNSPQYTLTSAHPTQVPKGTYDLVTWVKDANATLANTLVDRQLVVTKSETVTFDARQGRPIEFSVNDATEGEVSVAAESYASSPGSDLRAAVGPVYAIPGKLAPGFTLLLEASLYQFGGYPSPADYEIVRKFTGSIPTNLTFSYDSSQLALVHVTARAIDKGEYPAGYDTVSVSPVVPSLGYIPPAQQSGNTPFGVDFYLSPGYRWNLGTVQGSDGTTTPVLGARSYSQSLNDAVYGPSPLFGPTVDGNKLQLQWTMGEDLRVPPDLLGWGLDSPYSAWLYRGSKLLAHGTNRGLTATISSKPTWYTVRVQVNGDGSLGANWTPLFEYETDTFNFRAQSGDNSLASINFWPRMVPVGLNADNAEQPGTDSTVKISFAALKGAIAAHNVKVWASSNGGKTWTALHPAASGTAWDVVVTNPAAAGYVSLRAQGTNAAGFTASVTVINAYAVS